MELYRIETVVMYIINIYPLLRMQMFISQTTIILSKHRRSHKIHFPANSSGYCKYRNLIVDTDRLIQISLHRNIITYTSCPNAIVAVFSSIATNSAFMFFIINSLPIFTNIIIAVPYSILSASTGFSEAAE